MSFVIRASNTVDLIVSVPLCNQKSLNSDIVSMSEEIWQTSLWSAALCFAMECLHCSTVDNRNAGDQLLSLTLGYCFSVGCGKRISSFPCCIKLLTEFTWNGGQKQIGHDVQFLSCMWVCFVIRVFRTFGTKYAWFSGVDKGSALSLCRSVLISDETGISSQFLTHEWNDSL